MKKKNVVGIIIIALFAIGIVAALIVYKKMQMVPEKSQVGEEPETVVLSADENPFGIEIKKINEDYDLTRNYYKDYDNTGLQKYIIPWPSCYGSFWQWYYHLLMLRRALYRCFSPV